MPGGRQMPTLSSKQEKFAQEYALGATQEKAALAAGYSPLTAHHSVCRLLSNPGVAARIAEIQERALQDKLVTALKLHLRWSEMFEADIADILNPGSNTFKPIHEWPKIWRQMLAGIDVKELF